MATATKTLALTCPACLDESNDVVLVLGDLPTCRCDCGEEFTPEEAASRLYELANAWEKVTAWVKAAPIGVG